MKFFNYLLSVPGITLALVRFILVVVTMLIFVTAYGLVVLIGLHKPSRAFIMRKMFVRICLRILGIHVELLSDVTFEDTPCLYVCNHRSLVDPVITSKFINTVVLSKAEVKSYPLIGKGAEWSGVIYVDRNEKDSRKAARKAMEQALEHGFDVLVFPEGTVSGLPGTLPFRYGAFETAWQMNVPVIPIALAYRDPQKDFWTTGGLLEQYFKKFGKWKTQARIRFGPPVQNGDNGAKLAVNAEKWIAEELLKMQEGWILSDYPTN